MPRKPSPRRARGRPAHAAEVGTREALLDAAVGALRRARRGRNDVGRDRPARGGHAGDGPLPLPQPRTAARRRGRRASCAGSPAASSVRLAPGDASAGALVETIVRRVYAAAEQMPWMPPIWIREIVSEGGTLRDRMLRHFPHNAVTALGDLLAREQRRRRVPAGIEPRLAFLTIAGIAMLPLATRRLWSRIPEMADLSNAQLLRHALTVLAAGLAPAHPRAREHGEHDDGTTEALAAPRRDHPVRTGARRLRQDRRRRDTRATSRASSSMCRRRSPGALDQLLVKRGDQIDVGAPSFALEAVNEAAALRQAQEQLKAAQAQLADLNLRQAAAGAGCHARAAPAGAGRRAEGGHPARARRGAVRDRRNLAAAARRQPCRPRRGRSPVSAIAERVDGRDAAEPRRADQGAGSAGRGSASRGRPGALEARSEDRRGHTRRSRVRHALPPGRVGRRGQPGRANAPAAKT